jgi:hypothetical protein
MSVTNKARGECAIVIDNKSYNLCLTLGGLAELETAFAAKDLADLGNKLRKLSARDFLIVLMILLKGGANPLDLEFLKTAPIDTKAASSAISEAFNLAFND